MKDTTSKPLLVVVFGISMFLLLALISAITVTLEPMLLGILCIAIGLVSGDFSIVKGNSDLKKATFKNLIIITLLMFVTRMVHYIAFGYSQYTTIFNIMVSFFSYFSITTMTSFFYLYYRGEIQGFKW